MPVCDSFVPSSHGESVPQSKSWGIFIALDKVSLLCYNDTKGGMRMLITEALSSMVRRRGLTQLSLAKKMGLGSQAAVAQRLSRSNNMQMNTVLSVADACGYIVILQPKEMSRQDGQLVITNHAQ